jgi:ribosomal-protein-alanine N-acetyltransferase
MDFMTQKETPTEFSFRPASEEDVTKLLDIETRVHKSPWTAEHFKSEIAKPYSSVWVLTDDETDTDLAGYIVFWMLMDEAQILNVAVDLPYRGMGYAKRMVHQAVSAALKKGIRRVTLEVRKSNTAAIQLYQSQRFVITHVRKSFYSDGEDAYQMGIDLTEAPVEF